MYLWIIGTTEVQYGPLMTQAIEQFQANPHRVAHLQSWAVTMIRDVLREQDEAETFVWSGLSGCLASLVIVQDAIRRRVIASHYIPMHFDPRELLLELRKMETDRKTVQMQADLPESLHTRPLSHERRAGALIVEEPSCSHAIAQETYRSLKAHDFTRAHIRRERYHSPYKIRGGLLLNPGLLAVHVPPEGEVTYEGQMGSGTVPLLPL